MLKDRFGTRHMGRIALAIATCAFVALLASCGQSVDKPPIRDSVDAYSWSELSAISDEISAAANDDEALGVAIEYHLATADGKLDGTQAKEIELADGTHTRVVIAGFRHDSAVEGGHTGISFIFDDAVAYRPMNNNAGFDELDNDDDLNSFGGWTASELRSWLDGEFLNELPPDLRAQLAKVVKTSCVISNYELPFGTDYSPDSILSESVDSMWLPAVVELSGVSGETERAKEDPDRADILRKEGSQYQLFADEAIVEQEGVGNDTLVRRLAESGDGGTSGSGAGNGGAGAGGDTGSDGNGEPTASDEALGWWLRSTEYNGFAHVTEEGAIDRTKCNSGDPLGIVPCFSI